MKHKKRTAIALMCILVLGISALEVPAEYRPACSDCLFWYAFQEDNSEILLLWDKENRTLHLVEFFLQAARAMPGDGS